MSAPAQHPLCHCLRLCLSPTRCMPHLHYSAVMQHLCFCHSFMSVFDRPLLLLLHVVAVISCSSCQLSFVVWRLVFCVSARSAVGQEQELCTSWTSCHLHIVSYFLISLNMLIRWESEFSLSPHFESRFDKNHNCCVNIWSAIIALTKILYYISARSRTL